MLGKLGDVVFLVFCCFSEGEICFCLFTKKTPIAEPLELIIKLKDNHSTAIEMTTPVK